MQHDLCRESEGGSERFVEVGSVWVALDARYDFQAAISRRLRRR